MEDEDGFPLLAEDLVDQMLAEVPEPQWPTSATGFAALTPERLMGIAFQAGYRACVMRMVAMQTEEEDAPASMGDDAALGSTGVLGEGRDVRQITLTSGGLDTVPLESLLSDGGGEG